MSLIYRVSALNPVLDDYLGGSGTASDKENSTSPPSVATVKRPARSAAVSGGAKKRKKRPSEASSNNDSSSSSSGGKHIFISSKLTRAHKMSLVQYSKLPKTLTHRTLGLRNFSTCNSIPKRRSLS